MKTLHKILIIVAIVFFFVGITYAKPVTFYGLHGESGCVEDGDPALNNYFQITAVNLSDQSIEVWVEFIDENGTHYPTDFLDENGQPVTGGEPFHEFLGPGVLGAWGPPGCDTPTGLYDEDEEEPILWHSQAYGKITFEGNKEDIIATFCLIDPSDQHAISCLKMTE